MGNGDYNTIVSYMHCIHSLIELRNCKDQFGQDVHIAQMSKSRPAFNELVKSLKVEKTTGYAKEKQSWEDKIKTDLTEWGWCNNLDELIEIPQDRNTWQILLMQYELSSSRAIMVEQNTEWNGKIKFKWAKCNI